MKMRPSSALLRPRPAPAVTPMPMGWSGKAVRTTIPPAVGVGGGAAKHAHRAAKGVGHVEVAEAVEDEARSVPTVA